MTQPTLPCWMPTPCVAPVPSLSTSVRSYLSKLDVSNITASCGIVREVLIAPGNQTILHQRTVGKLREVYLVIQVYGDNEWLRRSLAALVARSSRSPHELGNILSLRHRQSPDWRLGADPGSMTG